MPRILSLRGFFKGAYLIDSYLILKVGKFSPPRVFGLRLSRKNGMEPGREYLGFRNSKEGVKRDALSHLWSEACWLLKCPAWPSSLFRSGTGKSSGS